MQIERKHLHRHRRRVGPGRGDCAHGRRRRAATSSSPTSRKRKGRRSPPSSAVGREFVRTDVTDEASGKAAVAAAVDGFGGLHGLVNCAGIVYGEKVVGKEGPHTLAGFVRTININLIGTFNMIRLAADVMAKGAPNAEGERGVIVNTASVAAFDGQIGQAAYSASKAGVVGMTLPIARELARYGIRVMTIAPGIFETPMVGQVPPGDRGVARQDGAVPAAPRPARRIRLARPRDRRQRDAERRSDPARRRDPHGAEVDRDQIRNIEPHVPKDSRVDRCCVSDPEFSRAGSARATRPSSRRRTPASTTGSRGRGNTSRPPRTRRCP